MIHPPSHAITSINCPAAFPVLALSLIHIFSKKAHLILPTHRILDAAYEAAKGDAKVGTTGKGIGPTYTDKVDVYKRQT